MGGGEERRSVGADRGELEGEPARRLDLEVLAGGEVAGAVALRRIKSGVVQ